MQVGQKPAQVRQAYEQNDAVTELIAQIRKTKALDWLLAPRRDRRHRRQPDRPRRCSLGNDHDHDHDHDDHDHDHAGHDHDHDHDGHDHDHDHDDTTTRHTDD